MKIAKQDVVYAGVILLCLAPFMGSSLALILGIVLSCLGLHSSLTRYKSKLLQISIVLMGFGMNLEEVIRASKSGFLYTAISVAGVVTLGLLLGRLFRVDKNTSLLISGGTAICGGSAIAAISSVIGAKDSEVSFSLIVVFVLNALALFIFPVIGRALNLDQVTFGNWAAIAIHDTSSVVGAGAAYGEKALEVATTVKLIRALWIIPLSVGISILNKKEGKVKIPWFIFIFVLAIIFANQFPGLSRVYGFLKILGKKGMVIALFLIGSGLSIENIREAGVKSFLQGVSLWIITAAASLGLFYLN